MCMICSDHRIDQINRMLVEEERSARSVGRKMGLSHSTLSRHRRTCLTEPEPTLPVLTGDPDIIRQLATRASVLSEQTRKLRSPMHTLGPIKELTGLLALLLVELGDDGTAGNDDR